MNRVSVGSVHKYLMFFCLIFSTLFTYAQLPSTSPKGVPATVPLNMTNPQLQTLLSDQNKGAGDDMNAKLQNKQILKDSLSENNRINLGNNSKSTYGANVFANASQYSITELSTPPLDYPIGVGDHVVVSLYGGAELQQDYLVASDGSIFPKGMGKIYVGGVMFENVRRILYSRFLAVVPAGTNIDISLGQPRSININVVNEVKNPGIITVSAFSNAFNVIARAGGITETGNLRNIQIKRNGRIIEELDVYKYLQTGDFGKHIYLQNNDFIIVPFYEKKILATGQFKRPMYYQLRKEEGIKALLTYSGGLTANALSSTLKIIRTENETPVLKDVNANDIIKLNNIDVLLQDGDIVKADLIKEGLTNMVEIKGEVKYPDQYEYRKGDRLFDLINRAGGVTKNTYLKRAYIFRGAGDSTNLHSAERLEIDLTSITNNEIDGKNNSEISPNDVIQLFSTAEFTDDIFVEIFGEVRKVGKVRKYGGMTLQDLLYLSGGLKPSAEFGRLEISSIVDIDSAKQGIKPTRTIVKFYAIQPNLSLDSFAQKIVLRPYDQIFVRKNPTFEFQQNIELRGLVKYPGLYPRLNKYEKLSSFIERAGGFQDNANLAGAVLYRGKTEFFRDKVIAQPKYDSAGNLIAKTSELKPVDDVVSIDLSKALKYKNSKHDIILQEKDIVFVPEINPFVSIQGRVQSPLKISFDKEHTNVGYYIDKAGGFGIKPWRSRIYVTYANGKSKRTTNFMFFHFYPRVEEGSFVTVPTRPEGQEIVDSLKTTLTAIVPLVITAIILKNIK